MILVVSTQWTKQKINLLPTHPLRQKRSKFRTDPFFRQAGKQHQIVTVRASQEIHFHEVHQVYFLSTNQTPKPPMWEKH